MKLKRRKLIHVAKFLSLVCIGGCIMYIKSFAVLVIKTCDYKVQQSSMKHDGHWWPFLLDTRIFRLVGSCFKFTSKRSCTTARSALELNSLSAFNDQIRNLQSPFGHVVMKVARPTSVTVTPGWSNPCFATGSYDHYDPSTSNETGWAELPYICTHEI